MHWIKNIEILWWMCWTVLTCLKRRIPFWKQKCLWYPARSLTLKPEIKTAIYNTGTVEFIHRDILMLCLSSPQYIGRVGYSIACSHAAAYLLVTTYLRCLVSQVSYHAHDVSSIWKQQKIKRDHKYSWGFPVFLTHLSSSLVIFVSATKRMQEMFNILLKQCNMLSFGPTNSVFGHSHCLMLTLHFI